MKGGGTLVLQHLPISPQHEHAIFFRIDPPKGAKVGSIFNFDIMQRDSLSGKPLGSSGYRVVVNRPAKQ